MPDPEGVGARLFWRKWGFLPKNFGMRFMHSENGGFRNGSISKSGK